MIMIVPVQWRDYANEKDMLKSFNNNQDFRILAPIGEYSKWDGLDCTKYELIEFNIDKIKVRFKKLTKIAIINLTGDSK